MFMSQKKLIQPKSTVATIRTGGQTLLIILELLWNNWIHIYEDWIQLTQINNS